MNDIFRSIGVIRDFGDVRYIVDTIEAYIVDLEKQNKEMNDLLVRFINWADSYSDNISGEARDILDLLIYEADSIV